ncbi:uncharacterized protein BHQ10_008542 [Talaromyces amestolkiae]|uniref:Peptidase M24 domain-containing protein n=1 Tax=Talaromyces amestolkiae TaxID=1196081 RepID=A0A364L9N4_TALAM|nr:uncharacterized protein BHQ10_008542 [Talaromyces amestolkiae]RAO72530.1 hypothetical protein BHQ10_008542 [Talaromyces amestolkiae]
MSTTRSLAYTLQERDRRWLLARDFMADHGVDALFVFGEPEMSGPGPYTLDNWVTNHRPGSTVIFPKTGEPLVLSFMPAAIIDHIHAREHGEQPWVSAKNIRMGRDAESTVTALRDLGLTESTIGVCGLEPFVPIHPSGVIPYSLWNKILSEFPKANFKSVGQAFLTAIMPLSDEQILVTRHAANIGDEMAQAMVKACAPGVPENEIFRAGMDAAFARGTVVPVIHMFTGPKAINWGPPKWHYSPQSPPRVLQDGDLVAAEIFCDFGKMQAQLQVTIAVGKVHQDVEWAAEIARQCYDAGLKALQPGNTFGEVAKAIREPLKENGAWSKGPQIHSLNPIVPVCEIDVDLANIGVSEVYRRHWALDTLAADMVLKPGMTFALEPTCAIGPLDAIEASLAEIKQLLLQSRIPQSQPLNEKLYSDSANNTIPTNNEVSASAFQSDEENTATDSFPEDGLPEESEQDVQVAPIKVVRHLFKLIHGSPTRDHNESIISELSKLGLTSGSLVDLLFEGFAIGTGQPPVIDVESLKPWITLKRNYDPCDRAIAAQLEIYTLLYDVVRKGVRSVSSAWDDLENWTVRNLQVDEEDYPGKYEATLHFTYLSVSLILARWEVAKLQAVPRQQHQEEEEMEEAKGEGTGEEIEFSDSATRQQRISSVIELIIRYSHLLLDKGMLLCSQTALVKPSYDFLISAYAGITLVEYASFLPNPKLTFELMEKVQIQGHRSYNPEISLEPVFNWATNVMRKKAQDYSVSMQQAELDAVNSNFDTTTNESRVPISMDWIPNTLIDSFYFSDHGDLSITPV